MFVSNWLGRLRFHSPQPRARDRKRHRRRARSRFGPLAFVESLESRTLLSAAPVIASFDLYNDTGTPGDYVTIDPTVIGTVTNDNGVAGLTIEIDVNGDGWADDRTTTNSNGVFIYNPAVMIFYGQVTINARPVEYDPQWATEIYGAWVSLTFVFHNEPASVATFEVLNNVGSSEYPRSLDGLLTGTLSNPDGGEGWLNVDLDLNGDGIPDHYTTSDGSGAFTFDVSMVLSDGMHTVHARADESNARGSVIGEWKELTFRYIQAPQITSFVAYSVGAYLWRLEGTVQYYDPFSLTIRFGGLAQGQAFVESDGSFEIELEIFDSGIVTAQTTDQYGRDSNLAEDYISQF